VSGVVPPEPSAVIGVATVHGGLIAVALVWAGVPVNEAAFGIVLLALARELVALHPLGVVGYLAAPVWIGVLAVRGRLGRLGLGSPWPWGAVAVGALAGATLAVHLFVCASRTLGYTVRFESSPFMGALAYDVGANILSAEVFFRGALLHHCWRRWPFPIALAVTSLAAAVRYCVDPFVAATELRVGAAVYMTMLALVNGVLCRWSGNLLPGFAAAVIFFACYRLLATG
jgi:membrane protease YdiL (CAAX protease family)